MYQKYKTKYINLKGGSSVKSSVSIFDVVQNIEVVPGVIR